MQPSLKRILAILVAYMTITAVVLISAGRAPDHRMYTDTADISDSGQPHPAVFGKRIWEANGCFACHSIFGLGGHLGPDLTNVMDNRDAAYIHHVLKTGLNRMPAYSEFTPAELDALVAYFEYLRGLGAYPLQSPWTQSFGETEHH